MEQVRRSNTVIYGEHYISAIYYGPCNSNNTAPSIGTITKRNITTGLFGLRTMRCITTTNKFSGIRFCFRIFVSRNKGFYFELFEQNLHVLQTCLSGSNSLSLLPILCKYYGPPFGVVFASKLNITPYNRLSEQQMLSGTQIISTSHGMTGRNFFDVFLPFHLLFGF